MWPQVVHYLFEGALCGIKPRKVHSAVDFWFSRGVIITHIVTRYCISQVQRITDLPDENGFIFA